MSAPGEPRAADELLVGPHDQSGRTPRPRGSASRALVDLLARPVARRGLLVGAAVLVGLTLGPGLLSGPQPTPEQPQRGGLSPRDAGTAGEWTGPPERPSGNRFVQSPVRLLRLPA